MKKLLYITANTKPEAMSSSRTVGRMLVNALANKGEVEVEELDLYATCLPTLKYTYFDGRSTLVGSDKLLELTANEQEDIAQVIRLCDQFVAADMVVLAAPMWSLSYPAVVKQYLDCIIISGKTIGFQEDKPYGLLSDRNRAFVYVQSSGMSLPWMLRPVLNKGMNYVENIMKFIGISDVHPLLVDGTGTTEEERRQAIDGAAEKVSMLADRIMEAVE
jgi:FMN-dependent NADH-azoreductase